MEKKEKMGVEENEDDLFQPKTVGRRTNKRNKVMHLLLSAGRKAKTFGVARQIAIASIS